VDQEDAATLKANTRPPYVSELLVNDNIEKMEEPSGVPLGFRFEE